jgi:parvulin-like peptidyl-prolyl isomerase
LASARLTVVETLIQEEALYQKAQQENLAPDDSKVTQEIQRRKQDARLTEDQYQTQLREAGLTEAQYRERVMRELAINALRDKERTRVNPPTEEEIRKYFEDNRAQFRAERGADISMIVADPANSGGPAGAEQKIRAIYEQLRRGDDFATVASQKSDDQTSALRGGRLGFASEAGLRQTFPTRPDIPETLMRMSPGQSTEPIKDNLSNAWYILKLNSKQEVPKDLTLDDVRQNIVDTITQQRQQVLLNALVMVARSEAKVRNFLAERVLQNPQSIIEMRPSKLLEQATSAPAQQPQPRLENQNQSGAADANANRRPASANANR